MVLLHGGSPKGAERIAARWADHRKVPQVAFKPDWTKHAKAAPFKRNDQMLDVLPIGVIVFPGTGIQENLADKARKLGIPVWKFGKGGAETLRIFSRIARSSTDRAAAIFRSAQNRSMWMVSRSWVGGTPYPLCTLLLSASLCATIRSSGCTRWI